MQPNPDQPSERTKGSESDAAEPAVVDLSRRPANDSTPDEKETEPFLSTASKLLPGLLGEILTVTACFLLIFGAAIAVEKVVDLFVSLKWVHEGHVDDLIYSESLQEFVSVIFHSFLYWIMLLIAGVIVLGDTVFFLVVFYRLIKRGIKRLPK